VPSKVRGLAAVCAVFALGAAGGGPAAPAVTRIAVTPHAALVDARVRVRVTGLPPGRHVTLEAVARDRTGTRWRSRLVMKASGNGVVDTRSNMRLFWSMQPLGHKSGVFEPRLGGTSVRVRALVGGRSRASASLAWQVVAKGVTAHPVTFARDGLVGTYFKSTTTSPAPALLELGGSEGGYQVFGPRLIASHGYPTLSLAYFKEPGLPRTLKDIPLEYFAKALNWLAAQPGVDSSRIILAGVSRGGEAALLIASTYPALVHGVLAFTPSAYVNGSWPPGGDAWTLDAKPIPQQELIPVQRISGPVFATGGGKDTVWPSAAFVDEIVQEARRYGRRDIVGAVYPNAGHDVGFIAPNTPTTGQSKIGRAIYLSIGGTLSANEEAWAAAWQRSLRFIATLPRK
jgi:dienelactone hydrolase